MGANSAAWVVVAALSLLGCGSRTGLLDGQALGGGGLAGSGGGYAGGAGGFGGEAGTPEPSCFQLIDLPAAKPVGELCNGSGDPGDDRVMAMAMVGDTLHGVRVGGSVDSLHTWTSGDLDVHRSSILSRAGVFAVGVVYADQPNNPDAAAAEVAAFGEDGEQLVSHRLEVPPEHGIDVHLTGNDHGVFAIHVGVGTSGRVWMFDTVGRIQGPFNAARLLTDPTPSGRIALRTDNPDRPVAWLDGCTASLTASAASQSPTWHIGVGDELLVNGAASGALLIERGSTSRSVPLHRRFAGSDFVDANPNGFALLSNGGRRFVSVDVEQASAREFELTFPAGLDVITPGTLTSSRHVAVSAVGGLLVGLREPSLGALYQTSDGANWMQVGRPVGSVHGVRPLSTLGTTLIVGDSLGLLPNDWGPPPPGVERIDREQLQVVNTTPTEVLYQAAVGTGFVRRYHLSADGGCVGHISNDTLFGYSVVSRSPFERRFPGRVSGTFGTWSWGGGPQRTISSNP